VTSYAILLRGVTPSGRNRVPMAALRDALAAQGLRDVRTYIQSGNVLVRSALGRAQIEAQVHEVIARAIGADIAVIARTHAALRRVMDGNPFAPEAAARTYFTLLASRPTSARIAALRALDVAPDAVSLAGDTLYTCYATKLSDSRFHNNVFERVLGVVATTRNFNTLSRLLALSA
jgi:uncharacterized protein (DUF1697 family)